MIGRHARVYWPAATHTTAMASLRLRPDAKYGYALYDALLPAAAPAAARLPSSARGHVKAPASRPQLRLDPVTVGHYRSLISESPLAPFVAPQILDAVRGDNLGELMRNPGYHRATMALATFQLWCERYGSVLGSVDPAELLGEREATLA